MRNMAELIEMQSVIYENIVKIAVNIRKDGADRKTADYFKRRMNNLEDYWKEYLLNHERINMEVSRTDPYYTEQQYEQTAKVYEEVKALINQQYQLPLMKAGNLSVGEQSAGKPRTPGSASKRQEEIFEDAGPSSRMQLSERVPVKQQGTNSRADDLLRRQHTNFKAFERTTSYIDVESISDKWEFEDVLKTLQSRWSAIDNLHWEIESELDGDNETYNNMYDRYDKKFRSLKKEINTKMWSVAHREKSTPGLEIPSFNGNYNQWVSFKDLFTEVIHNNPSLSNGQKMQHLKSKVRGEAEKLIQHLQISTDNYLVCWDILTHRYDNKRLIFTSHMNILLALPTMQQQSLPHLKRIHDTTLECLNAIKNLGVDIKSWDPMVVHMLSQKLDSDSYSEYVGSTKNSKELPILKDFMEFLETKFTTLETTARRKQDSMPQRPTNQTNYPQPSSNIRKPNFNSYNKANNYNNRSHEHNSVAKSMQVSNIKCPLCNNQHGIYNCKTYLLYNDDQKLKTANKLKLCTNCLFSHNGNPCTSTFKCRKCLAPHNTILHEAMTKFVNRSYPSTSAPNVRRQQTRHDEPITGTTNASQDTSSEILLATALLEVKDANGVYHNMRALVDQGSQISIITERAAQLLGIKRQRCKGVIFGVGQTENNSKGIITIECASRYNDFKFVSEVLIMSDLIKSLPNKTFSKPTWPYLNNINLADPEFYNSRPVDLLLGADVYTNIILGGIIKGDKPQQPMAQQTQLGWLLCGSVKTFQCNVILNNTKELEQFWQIEEINEPSNLSVEDQECVDYYSTTTKRTKDGRYEVRIPLKEELKHKLGSSKPMAIAQLKNLERRFERQTALAQKYKDFMNEYAALNHMKPENNINNNNITLECFLPHHAVFRESTSSSLRVVFNAASPTSSKFSLNDVMHKGPNLQKDLQSLLLQWRQFPYAFTADIEKMYRQIAINNIDRHLQKIVWRESPTLPIQTFQLATVTYGTKAAPFLAIMTLKQLASDERCRYPEAAAILEGSFYMDDLLHGCYNLKHGEQLIEDLMQLLKSGGFNLRKWSTNKQELLTKIQQLKDDTVYTFKNEDTTKTLGLCWNSKEDNFTFKCNFSKPTSKLTKRSLLSEMSKQFDPLGWMNPLSTKLKIIFQKLWKKELKWDDQVPDDIYNEWSKLMIDIENINHCVITRWIQCQEDDVIELHGFCDASIVAYACVVYARTKGQQKTVIVAAKSKLVPHKKSLTLPRLELCGAHLLSRLINKIKQSMNCKMEIYGWCDSTAVLGWLQGESSRWKPFVANRVYNIKQVMAAECWRYVKSVDNPADSASRGLTATQLSQHSLWWNGPSWLPTYDVKTEQTRITYKTEEESRPIKQVNIIQQNSNNIIIDELLQKHNKITKITRVLAWILRTLTPSSLRKQLPSYLTIQELRKAKSAIIKHVQRTELKTDIEKLMKHDSVATSSRLLNLNPFLDKEGFLRVSGRLRNAIISDEMKYPKIIPNKCRLAELLIEEAHQLTFHGGPRLTLATLRQQYWIPSGYSTTKRQLRNCVTCRKYEAKKQYQLMGDLPTSRINPAAPFYHTGVDYTGFVDVKANRGRSARTVKGYVAVFICMVTKAVHLELVSDLTSSAFLAALRRMSARRATPRHLYSDCGTNFVKANRMLQEEHQQLKQIFNDSFLAEVAEMDIEWHFNAPSWPSAGGLWERAVQSFKHQFRKVVGEQKLTFEEFSTILAQLEACLNTRPLCSLTESIEDLDYLSPASFLTGRVGLTTIETKEDARTRWHLTNNIFKQIWKKWKSEYLTQLTAREKWLKPQRNLQTGDMVVVHEDNIPAGKWVMGRVEDVFPGNDGYVRVVSVRTKNGILKRPVVKLSVLPIETADHQNTPIINSNQPARTTQNNKQTKTKSRGGLSYIIMAFVLFFTMCGRASCANYNITEIRNDQSLYFDPISKVSLIKDSWTLVVFYNMSPYWEGIQAFEKVITSLDRTCKTIGSGPCNMIVPQLIHEYNELKYYNELLMTQQLNEHSRQRRGLINGIGYLANSLFGVLDEQFAEKYRQDIDLIHHNEKHLAQLWKNQTSIVESENNLLKRTEEMMSKQHKIINKHLNNLDKMSNRLQQEINNITILQEFTLTALTATNLLHNLKRTQDVLLDILTNIHHGQFNIHLLTPAQLQRELNIISAHLSQDTTLPIEQQNIKALYPLLHIKARITEQYFIFQIKFPLISRDNFKLYRILSVPHQIGNSMMELIPSAEYVATDLKKDFYLTLTTEDISQCTKQEGMLMCSLKKPIYHLNKDNNFCEIDHSTEKCKVKRSRCENSWIPLTSPSLYLYQCCDNCAVKIICGDKINMENLKKAGMISLEPGCMLKSPDFIIHLPQDNQDKIQINSNIYVPELDQINILINTSLPFVDIQTTTDPVNIEQDLKKLDSRIKEMKDNQMEVDASPLSFHDIHQYVVSYILVGAGAVVASAALWRWQRRRARRRAPISPDVELQPTTSVSEPSASAGPSRPSEAGRQQSAPKNIYGVINRGVMHRACSPLPRRTLETLRF